MTDPDTSSASLQAPETSNTPASTHNLRLSKYVLITVIITVLMDMLFGYAHKHFGFSNQVMAIVFPLIGGGLMGAAIFASDTKSAPTVEQAHRLALFSSMWLLVISLSLILFSLSVIFAVSTGHTSEMALGLLLTGVVALLKAGAIYLLYRFFCFGWAAKRLADYEQRRVTAKHGKL